MPSQSLVSTSLITQLVGSSDETKCGGLQLGIHMSLQVDFNRLNRFGRK